MTLNLTSLTIRTDIELLMTLSLAITSLTLTIRNYIELCFF